LENKTKLNVVTFIFTSRTNIGLMIMSNLTKRIYVMNTLQDESDFLCYNKFNLKII